MPSALIKLPSNMVAPSVLTLVEGNTLKLKLEGIHKINVLQAHVDQPNILMVMDVKHNARSDSWQFEFCWCDFYWQKAARSDVSTVAAWPQI